ncbi:MAG: GNAT family N-acetyltransferase [Anaerolineae bacterium]|nr:GNAT family N-acetyltransferase [Anaerolineae bacterium]
MSRPDITPVLLATSQVKQGAALLARIFQHDPLIQFLLVDSASRLNKAAHFYQAAIRLGLLYGEVYTTPTLDGMAVWISPGHTDLTFEQLRKSGFLTTMLTIGLKPLSRFIRTASYIEKVKKQTLSTRPHWNLTLFGIDPSQQGQGLGGCLIEPILTRADTEYLPCYLESANERNLTFYRRHGFQVMGHGHVPKRGPQIWFMLREPGHKSIS